MSDRPDTPTPARLFAGLGVMAVGAAIPCAAVYATSGLPLWARAPIVVGVLLAVAVLGAVVLPAVLALDVAERAGPAHPGPGDTVHRVAWADRNKGCTDPRPHEPHRWYWEAEMPYVTFDGAGVPHHRTAPGGGHRWCPGVKP